MYANDHSDYRRGGETGGGQLCHLMTVGKRAVGRRTLENVIVTSQFRLISHTPCIEFFAQIRKFPLSIAEVTNPIHTV
jgi:hypothetical protein